MTTVIDHKTTNVGYNKSDLVYISVVSSVYRVVIQVVMIYVMLSQIDFLIVRVTADVLVTVVATRYFLRDKECASGIQSHCDSASVVSSDELLARPAHSEKLAAL